MMCRFFESAVKCMVLFDGSRDQGREQKEVMEVFSNTLVQTEIMIFQEVIEHRMEVRREPFLPPSSFLPSRSAR